MRAVRALVPNAKPADAKRALDMWEHVGDLSDREYAAVLGWTRRTCRECGELIHFVTDGPQPGWWAHDLVPAEDYPHAVVPEMARPAPGGEPGGGR
jgi:hypothetical protein